MPDNNIENKAGTAELLDCYGRSTSWRIIIGS